MTPPGPTDVRWLGQLPFWSQPQQRAAFVADVAAQLGVVAQEPLSARAVASAAAAEAAVAELCDRSPVAAPRVLAESLCDLGLGHVLPAALQGWPPVPPRARLRGSPYPGLRPFTPSEAAAFFGRGSETRRLLRLAAGSETPVILTGGAASGKTSLLQAGLLAHRGAGPAALVDLADLTAADGALWACIDAAARQAGGGSLAGAPPLSLAAGRGADLREWPAQAFPAGHGQTRWLLVCDGLEALLDDADGARARALDDLLGAAASLAHVDVVVSVGDDALGRCIRYPALAGALHSGRVVALTPPSPALLAWMLLAPVTRLAPDPAVSIPAAAAWALAKEAAAQPMPLLYLAARAPELYAACTAGRATPPVADLFGMRCATVLRGLDSAAVAALPRVLAALVQVPADGVPARARPSPACDWQEDAPARRLIDALAGMQPPLLRWTAAADSDAAAGAAAADPGMLVLSHPGLLTAWPQLRDWVDTRREALRLARRLAAALAEWRAGGRAQAGRWPHEQLDPARRQLAAAELLAELERDADMADFLTPEPSRLLREIDRPDTLAVRREDIGLRLARIGDPRPGVLPPNDLPRPRWCRIPAGRVMLDGRRAVRVAPFAMAAYPVTHAQFGAFLRAPDGFADARWWPDAVPGPYAGWWADQRVNYPVTQVSWQDATAFCRWLTARLGHEVRLPDEWEWQWAAQSAREDFLYPWGADWVSGRANTDEAGVGRTMAVGLYPQGRSLQGVFDLAGNIWEWCRNGFDQQTAPGAAMPAMGVIRGGSWRVNRGFARADFRLDALPEERVGSTGFRIACAGAALAALAVDSSG